VLVTGASGFIGSRLVEQLLLEDAEVHAVSRMAIPSDTALRWWQADLEDPEASKRLVGDITPDAVFHLASLVEGTRDVELVLPTLRANLVAAVGLLVAAVDAGCERVVLAGSMEEPILDAAEAPSSPYAAAKLAAGRYAAMFHALYGLPVVSLRIFMVYGPGQRDERKLIPSVILDLLGGRRPRIGSGAREIDWVYVDDVVDALVLAAGAPGVGGCTIDVGSGTLVPILDVVQRLADMVDPSLRPEVGAVADRPLDRVVSADVSVAGSLLGWKAQTGLDVGLRQTVGWYRDRPNT
jgi:UDP-glucose 4-epimerase